MSDNGPGSPGGAAALMNDSEVLAERLGAHRFGLRVLATADLGAGMRRIELTAEDLRGFEYSAGQDLMLTVGEFAGHVVRRRYTISDFEPAGSTGSADAVISVDILLHGDGPGARWAGGVQAGDVIEAIGPRGKVVVDPDADWALFIGDETFLPAAVSMAAAAPPTQTTVVVCEIDSLQDPPGRVPDGVAPIWVQRSPLAADPAPLLEALASLTFPAGSGHAFVGGEFHAVAALKRALADAGLSDDQISAKAYWRDATANANHGEPPRD